MKARSSRCDVVLWGRLPPPIGGVARSVEDLYSSLLRHDVPVSVEQPRANSVALLKAGSTLHRRHRVHIFNISGRRSLMLYGALARAARGRAVAVVHGGTLLGLLRDERLVWFTFGGYDELWCTNALLAAAVTGAGPTMIVSPFSTPPPRHAVCLSADRMTYLTAARLGHSLYRVDDVVEALQMIRTDPTKRPCLDVLLYGGHLSEHGRRLAWRLTQFPWVNVHQDLKQREVDTLLAQRPTVLRFTQTDGDSMLVRSALSWGCRVVASDVVPRPRGVELSQLTVAALVEAIERGGKHSDGSGLGEPIDQAVLRLAAALGV